MTPKEKAIELYDKYFFPHYVWENDSYQVDEKLTYEVRKRFSLIAVDEILETTKVKWATQRKLPNGEWRLWKGVTYKKYWLEVKQEIEKQ